MYCGNCGKEITDEAVFCPECGQKVVMSVQETPAQSPIATPGPTPGQTPSGTQPAAAPQPGQTDESANPAFAAASTGTQPTDTAAPVSGQASKISRTKLIAIVVAAAIVVCGAVGVFLWKGDQDAKAASQAAWNSAHESHAVVLPIQAPGYSDGACTPIPVHVTGTDFEGSAVDQVQYADATGRGVSLRRGTYVIAIAASPILSDGTIYQVPGDQVAVTIDDGVQSGQPVTVPSSQLGPFVQIAPLDMTEEQIQAAYQYALNSGMDKSAVEALHQKAAQVHADAVAQKQAADAAAAAAAAAEAQRQAELKAARHVETDYFSFDVPESWAGNFSLTSDNTHTESGGWSRVWGWASSNGGSFDVAIWNYSGPFQGNAGVTQEVRNMGTCSFNPSIKVIVSYRYNSNPYVTTTDAQRADSDYIVSTFRVK